MLNWSIAGNPWNWIKIFLMAATFSLAIQLIASQLSKGKPMPGPSSEPG